MDNLSNRDRQILRDLAKRQLELAHSEENKKLFREWEAAGALSSDARPMIRIELWTFAADVIPQLLRTEGEVARKLEWQLHSNIVNRTLFLDDTLVRDHIGVPTHMHFVPFGLDVKREETSAEEGGGLGHHFVSQIFDLEEDFEKLGPSRFGIDIEGTKQHIDSLNEVFGDILPVVRENNCLGACPMQDIVHIMSMEDMYVAMADEPELFHKMMDNLIDDYIRHFTEVEEAGVLLPTTKDQHLNQGTYCFTDDLKAEGPITLKDTWLYMDAQEAASISPGMFREFVVDHYKKLSERFGLLSYGCCEAVDAGWVDGLDALTNLRKISVSPWCDEEKMGEYLRGRKTVYLRKPSPNYLGVGSILDEDGVREHIKKTAVAARGCTLEIAQRDVYTLHNTPDKVRRYVELIRETVDRYWQP